MAVHLIAPDTTRMPIDVLPSMIQEKKSDVVTESRRDTMSRPRRATPNPGQEEVGKSHLVDCVSSSAALTYASFRWV